MARIPLLYLMAAGCASPASAAATAGEPAAAPTDAAAHADTAMPLRLPTDTALPALRPVLTTDDFELAETVWSACVDPEGSGNTPLPPAARPSASYEFAVNSIRSGFSYL